MSVQRMRCMNIHQIEQIVAGLEDDCGTSENNARAILAYVVTNGDREMLADIFRGLLLVWDGEQDEFDKEIGR